MQLHFNTDITRQYQSNSQKVRVFSEQWVQDEIYCPNCGSYLTGYQNNKPVGDFFCKRCFEEFELKSKKNKFGKTVSAGAYSKIIERLTSPEKPNFFFMAYKDDIWIVNDFFVVPKHFFIPGIIEQRKPLSKTAKRAGWIGSNILFSKVPNAGKIYYVENGKIINKTEVMQKWEKTTFLKKIVKPEAKGWILDIMNCIDVLGKQEFTLKEMYSFESDLAMMYPKNKHIKDKIRQQLQLLRDKGYLEFTGPATYRLI